MSETLQWAQAVDRHALTDPPMAREIMLEVLPAMVRGVIEIADEANRDIDWATLSIKIQTDDPRFPGVALLRATMEAEAEL